MAGLLPNAVSYAAAVARPNILVILMDDQRVGTSKAMPFATSNITRSGVKFTNAMVPVSLCCPSRTSLLTGNYSHTTGVWTDHLPYGGFSVFDDHSTVATWLEGAGYRTGLFGKYLNEYGIDGPDPYVPPGWDVWAAFHGPATYYKFDWIDSSEVVRTDTTDYSTYFFARSTIDFINSTPADTPFFAYFAPFAPHGPATPAPRDASRFSNLRPWRPPSYNEANVSDKPLYIQGISPWSPRRQAGVDRLRLNQYRTMYSADRAISWIFDALTSSGRLQNTIIVFMSDNGFLWGEHRLRGKSLPYDLSSRIPLSIRYDAKGWTGTRDGIVANVDIAPTLAQLAGVTPPDPVDGKSLVGVLDGTRQRVRRTLVVEHEPPSAPAYCGVRTARYLFVQYADGFVELYDYRLDPYELTNVASDPAHGALVSQLRGRAMKLCSPVPPGFTWN